MQENLLILRKRKGMSQREMANILGITETQYGAKERGESDFKGTEMFTIADFFAKPIENIFLPLVRQNGVSINESEE